MKPGVGSLCPSKLHQYASARRFLRASLFDRPETRFFNTPLDLEILQRVGDEEAFQSELLFDQPLLMGVPDEGFQDMPVGL